jgi:hypothetical protein
MAKDFASTFRKYAEGLSAGEKSASQLTSDLSHWVKESAEDVKYKIESEIEAAAIRMGFVRKSDLTQLLKRIADLEKAVKAKSGATKKPIKKAAKKTNIKKSTTSKRVAK